MNEKNAQILRHSELLAKCAKIEHEHNALKNEL